MTPIVPPRGRLLPASVAAVRIGIGIKALRSVIARGRIAVMRHESGRLQGIYESDCEAWVERNRTGARDVEHEPSRHEVHDVDQRMRILVPDAERVFG